MEKPAAEVVFKFKDDPIHTLILETLNKKPVNSDFYSLVKRIKVGDFLKRPVTTDNLDTVSKRAKEYMNEVGFAYGRLQEKNWGSSTTRRGKLRIHAPGPVINKKPLEEIDENLVFNDDFQTKTLTGFQKVKIPPIERISTINYSKARRKPTRPTARISASQRQAREYLNYLHALNINEQTFIRSQVSQKKKELGEKYEEDAENEEEILNARGIFTEKFNKARAKSMIPVKMQSEIKLSIEPMVRNAKDIVMKEKIREWQFNPYANTKNEVVVVEVSDRKERLLEMLERAITKKSVKIKKKEVTVVSTKKKKIKMHWVDKLNNTISETVSKTKPDEKITNMRVL